VSEDLPTEVVWRKCPHCGNDILVEIPLYSTEIELYKPIRQEG